MNKMRCVAKPILLYESDGTTVVPHQLQRARRWKNAPLPSFYGLLFDKEYIMVFRFMLLVWSLWQLLQRLIVTHLAVINDGSPSPDAAFPIADITLAQAFYGRLAPETNAYYRFEADPNTELRMTMLVPDRFYQAGFRTTVVLHGPGLPAEGLVMPSGDEGMRIGTTSYRCTQRINLVATGGKYLIEIRGNGSGVYCFCAGVREPDQYADTATRARVQALLES
jgi:hypothetical protein